MMKKLALWAFLALMLVPPAMAAPVKLGFGAFGGLNIPVVQDDQNTGNIFGIRARIKLMSFIVAEPNIAFGKWGAPDPIRGFDLGIDGSKIKSYGVDATIGGLPGAPGLKPFAVLGAGIYSIKNDDTGYDESKLGFSFGLGAGIGLTPQFDLDVRGVGIVAPQEEGSKKAVFVTGGLTYYFNLGY
jgi:hypothetical protein